MNRFRLNLFALFLVFSFFLMLSVPVSAQKEGSIWYFGEYAGLDFNTEPPTPLLNSAMKAWEGCATIADTAGNLLFYTDGITVWNREHKIMPGGTELLGNPSSTQSGVVIPFPQRPDQYILFCVPDANENGTLHYSIINMKDDDGKGAVTQKNISLGENVTEKVTAVQHENKTNIWILAHSRNGNDYLVYQVNETGIVLPPTKISIGVNHTSSRGYLKSSPDGKKIASALSWEGIVEVFNFDNSNGQLSNAVQIASDLKGAYGLEFSPTGNRLYVSTWTPRQRNTLSQYDLTASDIPGSKVVLAETSDSVYCALQVAVNGKIYLGKCKDNGTPEGGNGSSYLGVINFPDSLGTKADFKEQGQYLGGKLCMLGLPTFIQSFFSNCNLTVLGRTRICQGDTTILDAGNGWDKYEWSDGSKQSKLAVSKSGTYWVKVSKQKCFLTDTVTVTVQESPFPVDLGKDTTLCFGKEYLIDAGDGFDLYLWNDGVTGRSRIVNRTGTYWVSASKNGSCFDFDTLTVTFNQVLSFSDTLIKNSCSAEGDGTLEPVIAGGDPPYTYKWSNGKTTPKLAGLKAGTYTLTLTDSSGCLLNAAFKIIDQTIGELIRPRTLNGCKGDSIKIQAAGGYEQYRWNTGQTGPEITVTRPGKYKLTVINGDCRAEDSIEVRTRSFDDINLSVPPDEFTCDREKRLSATLLGTRNKGFNIRWFLDTEIVGFGDTILQMDFNGKYRLEINDPQCGRDTILRFALEEFFRTDALVHVPNAFSPNGDPINEKYRIFPVNVCALTFEIYDTYGYRMFRSEDPNFEWDGTSRGEKVKEGVYVYKLKYTDKTGKEVVRAGTVTLIY